MEEGTFMNCFTAPDARKRARRAFPAVRIGTRRGGDRNLSVVFRLHLDSTSVRERASVRSRMILRRRQKDIFISGIDHFVAYVSTTVVDRHSVRRR